RAWSALIGAGLVLTAACGSTSAGLTAGRGESAARITDDTGPSPSTDDTTVDTSVDSTDVPDSTDAPTTTNGGVDVPPGVVAPIDYGENKEPQPYDDLLEEALTDIQVWWYEVYPEVYGEPFEPL